MLFNYNATLADVTIQKIQKTNYILVFPLLATILRAIFSVISSIFSAIKQSYFSSYRDELLGILTAIEKLSGNLVEGTSAADMANEIFERVDKNADGKLSLEEFIEGAKVDNDLATMLENI